MQLDDTLADQRYKFSVEHCHTNISQNLKVNDS